MESKFQFSLYVVLRTKAGVKAFWGRFVDERHLKNYATKKLREDSNLNRVEVFSNFPWNCGTLLNTFKR
jgi:hypothetical protein